MNRFILLSALLLCTIGSISGQTYYSTTGSYTVKTLEFINLTDTSRQRTIPVKVHYPAEKGNFPLILISHGAGGDWDSHFALAHHLASHGYVVLCLEHVGSNTKTLKKSFRLLKNFRDMIHDGKEVLGRPVDVSFVITQATEWNKSNTLLQNKIDVKNIGVLGHSFGAYTSMAIAGMKPALDWLEPRSEFGKGTGPDLTDKRVKACVALSPQGVGEPFFIRESFYTLSTPLMGISGTEDKQQGSLPPSNRYEAFDYWKATGNNIFIWLNNAHHLDFSDCEGSDRERLRQKNRKEVQKIVRAAALLFFNEYLKHDATSKSLLNAKGLNSYLSGPIDKMEVRIR